MPSFFLLFQPGDYAEVLRRSSVTLDVAAGRQLTQQPTHDFALLNLLETTEHHGM